MAEQLSFDLPVLPALGREDFFVSPANAAAVAMIESWADWPGRKLLLVGPPGAGKTHLAQVWADLTGATIHEADKVTRTEVPALSGQHVAIENIEAIAGNADLEERLFHLHNLVLAEGRSLLLTASREANLWGVRLPDLDSRMQGTPAVILNAPDDALLAAVLMKLLADRQLSPSPSTIPYLVSRMDRSFESARSMVDQLDKAALSRKIPITRDLARKLLDRNSD